MAASALVEQITAALAGTALKATEIAAAVGAARQDVNSALYSQPGRFQRDAQFRWSLVSGPSAGTKHAAKAAPQGLLADLCRYYLDCLAGDLDDAGSFVWASSRYELGYIELPRLPLAEPLVLGPENRGHLQRLKRQVEQKQAKATLLMGYPVMARSRRSRDSGDLIWTLHPLLVWRVATEGEALGVLDVMPEVVTQTVRQVYDLDIGAAQSAAFRLSGDIFGDRADLTARDVFEALDDLMYILAEWPIAEAPSPDTIVTNPPASAVCREGLHNRAIVWASAASPYTAGLREELNSLARLGDQVGGSALGAWLSGHIGESGSDQGAVLEVLPMNAEQRDAVRMALGSPLSVITGPPGTGKSQLVTNIVLNCALNQVSVLVASKNNKAVDVVCERANGLSDGVGLLRLGYGHNSTVAQALQQLAASSPSATRQKGYDSARQRFARLADERLLAGRAVEELADALAQAQDAEPLRLEAEARLTPGAFDRASVGEAPGCADFAALRRALGRLARPASGPLHRLWRRWTTLGTLRQARAWLTAAAPCAAWVDASAPEDPEMPDSAARALAWMNDLEQRLGLAAGARRYELAINRLATTRRPEQLAAEFDRLDGEVAASSRLLWDLHLACNPALRAAGAMRTLAALRVIANATLTSGDETTEGGRKLQTALKRRFAEAVRFIPAWAVTNLSARSRIPMEPGIFDLLVIDEASQCDIASVLPLLYRAKRAVVIGDPNQLRHIASLTPARDLALMARHGLSEVDIQWSYSSASLYDRAHSLAPDGAVVSLVDHHRSHADIIEFSNRNFYAGRLRVATRHDRLRSPATNGPAVRWIDVEGTAGRGPTGSAVNRKEAVEVVAELRRLLVDNRYDGSVGVVTPFREQAKVIRELIIADPALSACGDRAGLLTDTVDRFQGDERDLMLFSTVVSTGIPKSAVGFIARERNRFNVAVTRARAALVVVGNRTYARQSECAHLRALAEYEPGRTYGGRRVYAGDPYVSNWEELLRDRLVARGLRPIQQHPVEHYRLDLALVVGGRQLDVEVDGEQHRALDGEHILRDILRDRRMMELGWDVMRFWVYEVRDRPEQCVDRVLGWVRSSGKGSAK